MAREGQANRIVACAMMVVLVLSGSSYAANFTISQVASTSQETDPFLKTQTDDSVVVLPQNFMLDFVGDFHTFDASLYYTDETSAEQDDDENLGPTSIALTFTAPEAKVVTLTGNTFADPPPGTLAEAGFVTFGAPVQVDVGGNLLEIAAADTFYNNGFETISGLGTVPIGLQTSSSGIAFGQQVPITITLLPEPTTAFFFAGVAGMLACGRHRRNR